MSMHLEWDTASTCDATLVTKEELRDMADAPDEVDSGGLILGGGGGGALVIEGEMDDLFEFIQGVVKLLGQQQLRNLEQQAGRSVGSLVRIGSGTKVWRITGFTRMGLDLVAHLAPMPGQGFSTTSVVTHRLRDAD